MPHLYQAGTFGGTPIIKAVVARPSGAELDIGSPVSIGALVLWFRMRLPTRIMTGT